MCLIYIRLFAFSKAGTQRPVGAAAVFAPGWVGGQRQHYEDGRGCHSGTLFAALQAFPYTLLFSRLMLLLQWPFQNWLSCSDQKAENG